jgi:hypothetical protein
MSTGASSINPFTGINRAQVITLLAAPPAIGGTTPNTGAFTGLSASSDLTLSGAPGKIKPAANSATAIQFAQADGTAFISIDTSSKVVNLFSTANNAYPEFRVTNNAGTSADRLGLGVGGTATGDIYQNSGYFLTGTNLDALLLQAAKTTGVIKFYAGGATNTFLKATLSTTELLMPVILTLSGAPGKIRPAANSTTALQVAQADGTAFVTFDTTNKIINLFSTANNTYPEIRVTNNGGTTSDRLGNGVGGTATGDLYQNSAYLLAGANLDALLLQVAKASGIFRLIVGGLNPTSEILRAATSLITIFEAVNIATGTTSGTKIGTSTSQKLGFYNAAPVARQTTYTQTFSTAASTMSAYTTNAQNSAYTGIDNAQAGTVYAKLTDLNLLRVAYENLRAMADNVQQVVNKLIDDNQAYGFAG